GNAVEAVVAMMQAAGEHDAALDWLAGLAGDEGEDWELRLSAGDTLLDLAPVRYRALLESLAERQTHRDARFKQEDVAKAYDDPPGPQWERRFENPWEFYDVAAI